MMTILNIEARPANPDQLILRGLKKSAHRYLLNLPIPYILAERVEYMKDTFASVSSEICAPGGLYLSALHVAPWPMAQFPQIIKLVIKY